MNSARNTQAGSLDDVAPQWREEFEHAYPQLAHVKEESWAAILTAARFIKVPANQNLLEQLDLCQGFLLLLQGGVRVFQYAEDGRELTLYRLEPGDICIKSLNSLMTQKPFGAIARTETEVHALALSPAQFHDAMNLSEGFRTHILVKMSSRYCDMLNLVQDTVFKRLDMRLACLLGSLFEKSKGDTITITHQELAKELGTTREVVSRLLKEMERQDCIHLSRGRIQIASEDGLRWFARDRL